MRSAVRWEIVVAWRTRAVTIAVSCAMCIGAIARAQPPSSEIAISGPVAQVNLSPPSTAGGQSAGQAAVAPDQSLADRVAELERLLSDKNSAAPNNPPADTNPEAATQPPGQPGTSDASAMEPASAPEQAEKQEPNYPSFNITGFLQLDSAWYAQGPDSIATVGDAQDGTGFRRARLATQGKVADYTAYQLEMDFATAGRPSFFDCYVEQSNLRRLGAVRIGQFCQPFSADALTGFRNLTFLERSLPFLAFVPFRRVGISSAKLSEDERTAWTTSLYRTGGFNNAPLGDDRFAIDFGDIGGYSLSTRLTRLIEYDPGANDGCLWHVGGGYAFGTLAANDAIGSGQPGNAGSPRPFYQARTTPEFGPLGYLELGSSFGNSVNATPSFADTGRYEADSFHLFGLETLRQVGPWGLTAEYISTLVHSVAGPVYYQGGYVQLAYRLTGEHRVYNKQSATLGSLKPDRPFSPLGKQGVAGWGAWEVAARWSVVDLRNPSFLDGHYYVAANNTFTGTSKSGNGVLNDSTLGLTWFLNTNTKVQFNWIHAMLDNTANGWSEADLFVTRVHVDF